MVAERNRQLRAMVAPERGGAAAGAAGGRVVPPVDRQLQAGEGRRGSGSLGAAAGTAGAGSGSGQRNGGSSVSGASGSRGGRAAGAGGGGKVQGAPAQAGRPLMLVDIDGLTQDLPPGLAVAPLD